MNSIFLPESRNNVFLACLQHTLKYHYFRMYPINLFCLEVYKEQVTILENHHSPGRPAYGISLVYTCISSHQVTLI